MKKYIIILAVFLTSFYTFGQEKKESREKIKALKIAFLTQELQLTSVEAQKFWPIYNQHEEKLDFLRNKGRYAIKQKIKEVGDLNNLDESEAKKFIMLRLDLEKKTLTQKEEFLSKVSAFLPYKKILKLHISEREFTRKLMRKYGRDKKTKE